MLNKYKITINIIIVLSTVFLLTHYYFDNDMINNIFSLNYNSFLANPLVVITSMFLHANFMHILMNLIALFQIGIILESLISIKRYLKLFAFSGLMSSIFSIIYIFILRKFNIDTDIYVLGASGAIFGLYIYMSLTINQMKSFYINVVILHILAFIIHIPIAWFAHLGGIVGGLLYFVIEYRFYKNKMFNRRKFN